MGPGILPETTVGKHNLLCHLQMPTKALSCKKEATCKHGPEALSCPVCQGVRVGVRGMRRGLNGAGEWVLYSSKKIKQNKPKLPRRGKTGQLAGLARQDRARCYPRQDNIDGEHTMTNWHGTANTRRL